MHSTYDIQVTSTWVMRLACVLALFTLTTLLIIAYPKQLCAVMDRAELPTVALRVFTAEPAALEAARASYTLVPGSDQTLGPAFDRLFADAALALAVAPPSVTDKKHKPPSGDPHDYLSLSPYCWPDPVTGKCSMRDGVVTAEAELDSDATRLMVVRNCSQTLALAYYLTGNHLYACKAADFLRTFFLSATTRMNPNLNYGQSIPHQKVGRWQGLIRSRLLLDLVDVVGLLAGSACWTAADQDGMRHWMQAYLGWMLGSDLGRKAVQHDNNHGSFYDVQLAGLALFVGSDRLARRVLSKAANTRLAVQISPDGRQEAELKRTQSLHYSVFNLEALTDLALLGRHVGVDLWSYGPGQSSLLEAALNLVAPYVTPQSAWPLSQIEPFDRERLSAVLIRGAPHYPGSRCLLVSLSSYERNLLAAARERLMFVTLPLSDYVLVGDGPDGCPDKSVLKS